MALNRTFDSIVVGTFASFISDNYIEIGNSIIFFISTYFQDFWKYALALLLVYWLKSFGDFIRICDGFMVDMTHKYDFLLVKLDLMQRKLVLLQDHDVQELKKKNEEMAGDIALMRSSLRELQVLITSNLSVGQKTATVIANTGTGPAPPPPPPPPLPPGLLMNPTPKLPQPCSSKSAATQKKKAPNGPPQLSFSQAEISDMLRNLKKTSNKARLLDSEDRQAKKTPPRRKLFSRSSTSGPKRRRSLLSPANSSKTKSSTNSDKEK